jgi:hypothetical protein
MRSSATASRPKRLLGTSAHDLRVLPTLSPAERDRRSQGRHSEQLVPLSRALGRSGSVDALPQRGPVDGLGGGIRIGRPGDRIPVLRYFPFDVVLHLCSRSSPLKRPFLAACWIATSRQLSEPHLFGFRGSKGRVAIRPDGLPSIQLRRHASWIRPVRGEARSRYSSCCTENRLERRTKQFSTQSASSTRKRQSQPRPLLSMQSRTPTD